MLDWERECFEAAMERVLEAKAKLLYPESLDVAAAITALDHAEIALANGLQIKE